MLHNAHRFESALQQSLASALPALHTFAGRVPDSVQVSLVLSTLGAPDVPAFYEVHESLQGCIQF